MTNNEVNDFSKTFVVDDSGNPKVVYHGTSSKFKTFRGSNIFFTDNEDVARAYGTDLVKAYLNITNPYIVDAYGQSFNEIYNARGFKKHYKDLTEEDYEAISKCFKMSIEEAKEWFPQDEEGQINLARAYGQKALSTNEWARYAHKNGYDGCIIYDVNDTTYISNTRSTDYIVFNASQIKVVTEPLTESVLMERILPDLNDEEYQYLLSQTSENGKANAYTKWFGEVLAYELLDDFKKMDVERLVNLHKKYQQAGLLRPIATYRSVDDLVKDIKTITDNYLTRSEKSSKAKKGAVFLGTVAGFNVYEILTQAAAIKYGKGTRWCTSQDKSTTDYFRRYTYSDTDDNYESHLVYALPEKSNKLAIEDNERYGIEFNKSSKSYWYRANLHAFNTSDKNVYSHFVSIDVYDKYKPTIHNTEPEYEPSVAKEEYDVAKQISDFLFDYFKLDGKSFLESSKLKESVENLLVSNDEIDDIAESYDVDYVLNAFKENKSIWYPLIEPNEYKKALEEFVKNGDLILFPLKKIAQWFKIIVKNSYLLSSITDITGHGYNFPSEIIFKAFFNNSREFNNYLKSHLESDTAYDGNGTPFLDDDNELNEYAVASKLLDENGFYDWARLPNGDVAWSDYGIKPIFDILAEYDETMPAKDLLVLINRVLDVYHQNGDLSAAFVKGGAESLSAISNGKPLSEALQTDVNSCKMTKSIYDIVRVIRESNQETRILYDPNMEVYAYGNSIDTLHITMFKQLLANGYYPIEMVQNFKNEKRVLSNDGWKYLWHTIFQLRLVEQPSSDDAYLKKNSLKVGNLYLQWRNPKFLNSRLYHILTGHNGKPISERIEKTYNDYKNYLAEHKQKFLLATEKYGSHLWVFKENLKKFYEVFPNAVCEGFDANGRFVLNRIAGIYNPETGEDSDGPEHANSHQIDDDMFENGWGRYMIVQRRGFFEGEISALTRETAIKVYKFIKKKYANLNIHLYVIDWWNFDKDDIDTLYLDEEGHRTVMENEETIQDYKEIREYANQFFAKKYGKKFLTEDVEREIPKSFKISIFGYDPDILKTSSFKAFFKGSKIKDKEGYPLVLYHGTNASFEKFDNTRYEGERQIGADEGYFFTPNKKVAQRFGSNLKKVFLNIKNPREIDGEIIGVSVDREYFIKSSKEMGYDGIIIHNADTGAGIADEYIVYDDSQIFNIPGVTMESFRSIMEGVSDILKYYPKLSEEKIKELIALDPTYKGGDQLGKFGKWILNIYNRGNLKEEDFYKVKDYLTTFKLNYNKMANKDLNAYKGLPDLYTAIEPYIGHQDVSHKQEIKNIKQDAEKVFEDDNWLVIIPHTEEASCYYGKNTQWCTAATKSGNMFKYYNDQGPLYININKKTNEKFQFHFETNSFMDETDSRIDFKKFIKNNSDLKEFYLKIMIKANTHSYLLPTLFGYDKDEEANLNAVKKSVFNIQYISNPSEEVKLEAATQDGIALQFIDNPTDEMKYAAVKSNSVALSYIKNPSDDLIKTAVKYNGKAIEYVDNPSEELQVLAVTRDYFAIECIKDPCEKAQIIAVQQRPSLINVLKNPSENVKAEALTKDPRMAIHIADELSDNLKKLVVQKNGTLIGIFKDPSEELQKLAVEQTWEALRNIENPTEDVQLTAIQENGNAIQFVENPTEDMKMMAIESNPWAIEQISHPTLEMAKRGYEVLKQQIAMGVTQRSFALDLYVEEMKNRGFAKEDIIQ
jgi:hypothetical protein